MIEIHFHESSNLSYSDNSRGEYLIDHQLLRQIALRVLFLHDRIKIARESFLANEWLTLHVFILGKQASNSSIEIVPRPHIFPSFPSDLTQSLQL